MIRARNIISNVAIIMVELLIKSFKWKKVIEILLIEFKNIVLFSQEHLSDKMT
jgi:hypothetical protein